METTDGLEQGVTNAAQIRKRVSFLWFLKAAGLDLGI